MTNDNMAPLSPISESEALVKISEDLKGILKQLQTLARLAEDK